MGYVFAPAAVTALSICGTSELFPVRRIYCVGRNYADHAARWATIRTASRRSSS